MADGIVMVKDGGVGLGTFLFKKKVFIKKQLETFLSLADKFMVINLGKNKISWTIITLDDR